MSKDSIEVDFSEAIASMNQSRIVSKLIQLQIQFKIFHWQTFSFSQHKTFGEVYAALNESIDEFVETYQGIYGRFDFSNTQMNFNNLNISDFNAILKDNCYALTTWNMLFNDSDLLNIRDEILGSLNQASYLLTLN